MKTANNSGKLIGALLIGAAVGGILGILFAPDEGSETRKKITGKSDDLTDSIKEKLDDFLEEIKEEVAIVKERANAIIENGQTKP